MSDEAMPGRIIWSGDLMRRKYPPGRYKIESDSYTLANDGDHLHAVADLEFEQGNLCHDTPWLHSALRLPLDVRGAAAVIRRQFSAAERVELLRLIKWGEEAEP